VVHRVPLELFDSFAFHGCTRATVLTASCAALSPRTLS